MQFGIIGLGRIGMAMSTHALEKGLDVVAFNRSKEKVDELRTQYKEQSINPQSNTQQWGTLLPAYLVEEVVKNLTSPRVVLLMLPAGEAVDELIEKLLLSGLSAGDIVIDGGNSFYKDSIRRYHTLNDKGIHFVDMGTSGGIEGARHGACLTIGGDRAVYERLEPLFKVLAVSGGYGYVGGPGAGHFVKVTHNGIEYGMLQAIGEGFAVLEKGPYALDMAHIARIWSHGSVIRGWLMTLAAGVFTNDATLSSVEGVVGGGETGKWTVAVAKEEGVSVPVLEASLKARQDSYTTPSFAGKVIAALRNAFGRHETIAPQDIQVKPIDR